MLGIRSIGAAATVLDRTSKEPQMGTGWERRRRPAVTGGPIRWRSGGFNEEPPQVYGWRSTESDCQSRRAASLREGRRSLSENPCGKDASAEPSAVSDAVREGEDPLPPGKGRIGVREVQTSTGCASGCGSEPRTRSRVRCTERRRMCTERGNRACELPDRPGDRSRRPICSGG